MASGSVSDCGFQPAPGNCAAERSKFCAEGGVATGTDNEVVAEADSEVVVGEGIVDETVVGEGSTVVLSALPLSEEQAASSDITTSAVAAAPMERPLRSRKAERVGRARRLSTDGV
ncbi:hypothetical protein [Rhodococcus erythropolis]|uniref:hypothetical protein n=1 Tax=Rhodococcus erythropolis TaxID=1833 RepID=UPI0022B4EBB3|nr:hypothetical protein [Rhodococcus erythropolis]MCZ4566986.1 hypothetical protein [Rhodococcus erythropolis]